MTATHLPGQLELATVVDHRKPSEREGSQIARRASREVQIAKLLRQYEDCPTSETWSRIQSLAAEILK